MAYVEELRVGRDSERLLAEAEKACIQQTFLLKEVSGINGVHFLGHFVGRIKP
jgi:hypothetical protein